MPASGSILGNAVLRVEDPAVLRGEARYFDDLAADGVAHVVFVRSTIAHARIEAVDTSEAEAMPGRARRVHQRQPRRSRRSRASSCCPPAFSRPPLAVGTVRFVGDIVAAVVAETRAQAVDAAEMVIVDYDPLAGGGRSRGGPRGRIAAAVPRARLEPRDRVRLRRRPDGARRGRASWSRAGSSTSVSPRCRWSRTACWSSPTPTPAASRSGCRRRHRSASATPLAEAIGLAPDKVRVVAPMVGGGFGAKTGLYPEFVVAARLALDLGRPVKWTETRSENMVAMTQGRAQVQYVELGLKRDGTITGLRVRIVADGGAYPAVGAFLPFLTRSMSQGVYRIPKVQFTSRSAATNTTATAAYRGAGRPEATAMLERIIDMAAVELGHRSGRDPQAEPPAARRLPAHHRHRCELRRRRVREGARRSDAHRRLRRAARRAASPPRARRREAARDRRVAPTSR